MFLIVFVDR